MCISLELLGTGQPPACSCPGPVPRSSFLSVGLWLLCSAASFCPAAVRVISVHTGLLPCAPACLLLPGQRV